MKKWMVYSTVMFFMAIASAGAVTITDLVGDMDNFGTGLPTGTAITYIDYQNAEHEVDDGDMDIDQCLWCKQAQFEWIHEFSLPPDFTISGAKLTISTFDLEDGGAGDGKGGAPYDTLLFIDGVEIPAAFDDVYTEDAFPIIPNLSVFEFSPDFFNLLADGSLHVMVDPFGGQLKDCVAIDYALLEIEVDAAPVPEPSTIALLGIGLIGLAKMRRRFV